jgi:protein-histidine N-methyltransferase
LPNLLLAYYSALSPESPDEGELDMSEDLLDSFKKHLASQRIDLRFFYGDWAACQIGSQLQSQAYFLCLTSETVYNKANLPPLCRLLQGCTGRQGSSLVACKRLYFGLDGGEAEFKHELAKWKGQAEEVIWPSRPNAGVDRVVLKVQFT